MRILFLYHRTTPDSGAVDSMRQALIAAGQDVRSLVVAASREAEQDAQLRTVVCRAGDPAADVAIDLPRLNDSDATQQGKRFVELTDKELTDYRQAIRQALDFEIDRFNPDVIHAGQLWIEAQLALETGVPYVANAGSAELAAYATDPRCQALVDQAAENASRVLVSSEPLRQRAATFEAVADRLVMLETPTAARLLALYREVLEERFGKRP